MSEIERCSSAPGDNGGARVILQRIFPSKIKFNIQSKTFFGDEAKADKLCSTYQRQSKLCRSSQPNATKEMSSLSEDGFINKENKVVEKEEVSLD